MAGRKWKFIIKAGQTIRISDEDGNVSETKAVVVEDYALTVHEGNSINGLAFITFGEELEGRYRYRDLATGESIDVEVHLSDEHGDIAKIFDIVAAA